MSDKLRKAAQAALEAVETVLDGREVDPLTATEQVARWMIEKGYATGHGDDIDDLLRHLVQEVQDQALRGGMTETQRAAMEGALAALTQENPLGRAGTIAALRAALAEPEVEQEPVAWMSWSDGAGIGVWDNRADAVLYSASDHEVQPLYAAPPRREWVPLTDEEIRAVIEPLVSQPTLVDALMLVSIDEYRAIEAALKEKNHDI